MRECCLERQPIPHYRASTDLPSDFAYGYAAVQFTSLLGRSNVDQQVTSCQSDRDARHAKSDAFARAVVQHCAYDAGARELVAGT